MSKIVTMGEVLERARRRTNRDRAVELKAKGLSVEQIAERLGVNRQTIYSHLSNAKKAKEKSD